MVITMPASLATLFEVAMAAEGLGFECVGEGSRAANIANAPIEQDREVVSKAAADPIEVVIADENNTPLYAQPPFEQTWWPAWKICGELTR